MPWIRPPRINPWQKAASAEPAVNAKVQCPLLLPAIQRNSNATPRNTNASSMMMTGK
jgi:hypothetical protein